MRHARDKLAALKQTSSVHEYVRESQELVMQIPGMDQMEQLDRFVRGLKPRTRQEVVMRGALTLDEAVRMADTFDSLFTGLALGGQFSGYRSGQGQGYAARPSMSPAANPTTGPTPMEVDALNRKLSPLTQAERDRLRKIGGCFRCREPGHIAPNCPTFKPAPGNQKFNRPKINQVEQADQPDLIDWGPEPRSSENSMPQ